MVRNVADFFLGRLGWLAATCRRQSIFLSYSSLDRTRAEEIAQALITAGHRVFFDRRSLKGGDDYSAIIRRSIAGSQRFVFLISQNSLAAKAYTLTELEFARAKWPSPAGPILPVLIDATVPLTDIPVYLRSINIFQPQGNAAAEIVRLIDETSPVRLRCWMIAALLVLVPVSLTTWSSLRGSRQDVVLEPFEKVHFRPLAEPPANTANPTMSTTWEDSPVTVTVMPVVYNHRSSRGEPARLLDEKAELTVGARHFSYRWAYVVEINTRHCADWLCVTRNAGPSTLTPGEISPPRETMFLPTSEPAVTWREFFGEVLRSTKPFISVTFRSKIDRTDGDKSEMMLERTCTVDVERARAAFLARGYTAEGRAMAPFLQSSCEESRS